MINSVTPTGASSDLVSERWPAPAPAEQKPPPAAQGSSTQPAKERNLRLLIELDDARKVYVYKLVDRETGRIITSIPRSDLEKLSETPSYEAGGVVSTTA